MSDMRPPKQAKQSVREAITPPARVVPSDVAKTAGPTDPGDYQTKYWDEVLESTGVVMDYTIRDGQKIIFTRKDLGLTILVNNNKRSITAIWQNGVVVTRVFNCIWNCVLAPEIKKIIGDVSYVADVLPMPIRDEFIYEFLPRRTLLDIVQRELSEEVVK